MAPQYVAKKSKVTAFTGWTILALVLFFWTLIPIIYVVIRMFQIDNDIIEFYEDSIVIKKGWIAKSERKTKFTGIVSVAISQSVFGAMFNYGDLEVDVYGKWDIDTTGIANPRELKNYLENRIGGGSPAPAYVETI